MTPEHFAGAFSSPVRLLPSKRHSAGLVPRSVFVGIAGLSLNAGLVLLPVLLHPELLLAPATVWLLLAASLLAAAELTRGRWTNHVEEFAYYGRYQQLALMTGILLLMQNWWLLSGDVFSAGTTGTERLVVTGRIQWVSGVAGGGLVLCGCLLRLLAIRELRDRFVSDPGCGDLRRDWQANRDQGEQLTTERNAMETPISDRRKPRNDKPCCSGVYALMRHPSEAGLLLYVTGIAICLSEWRQALIWASIHWFLSRQRIALEEPLLLDKFGATYQSYQRTTKQYLPWYSAFQEADPPQFSG
ncbi:MAG: hypothetical protein KDA85_10265 [Planctomycetaceae bacterium]|nr:hypothetical protein [Planctomycetaceae bacterium]